MPSFSTAGSHDRVIEECEGTDQVRYTERRRFQEASNGTQDVEVLAVFDLGLAVSDDRPWNLKQW